MIDDSPTERWIRDYLVADRITLERLLTAAEIPFDGVELHVIREYRTTAGNVDILVAYRGGVVVIECKRDLADESAVAQCLRYMGALHAVKPRGIVAARRFTIGAKFAAHAIRPAVMLVELEVAITIDSWQSICAEATIEKSLLDRVFPKESSELEKSPLPVFSGALEGGGGAPDVLVGSARPLDRHDV